MPYVDVASPDMPQGYTRAVADRMAARAASGQLEPPTPEQLSTGGELIRAAAVVRRGRRNGARRRRRRQRLPHRRARVARPANQDAYEDYTQLRVLRRPLAGVYLSFFLMMTLMILVGATWMGLYLAKRITEPVQRLATAAREIEAGHLDYRVDRGTVSDDEFGSLVEAFNSMASEVGKSRRRLERSTVDLERKHVEVEGRRRYIETILERIATGVVSIDRVGRISTLNSAAMRLLGLGRVRRRPAGRRRVRARGSAAVRRAAARRRRGQDGAVGAGDCADARRPRAAARGRRHGAARHRGVRRHGARARRRHAADPRAESGRVARGGAAPRARDQESADADSAVRRAHAAPLQRRAGPTQALVEECTSTIVGEVDSLKALVDEFSQFARMPAPRAVPTDLHALLNDALALYQGLLGDVRFERRFAASLPKVRVDVEQIRRVIINLVDNAIEAMNRSGVITLETQHDPARRSSGSS